MASRVNVKFVVLLASVLILVAGATGFLAWKVVFKTSEDLAAKGDIKMAEGEYKAAELLYSKAVNKDPYNSVYLLKWRDAIEHWTPESDKELQTEFSSTYRSINSQLALSDNLSHTEYQLGNLNFLLEWMKDNPFSRLVYEGIADDATRYIEAHEAARPDHPDLPKIKRARGLALGVIAQQNLDLALSQRELAESDLAIALADDPADYEVLETILTIKQILLNRAETAGRLTEAERIRGDIASILTTFLEANDPDTLSGILASMLIAQRDLKKEAREIIATLGDRSGPEIQNLAGRYNERTHAAALKLASLDQGVVDSGVLRRLYALETQTDTTGTYEATIPLARAAADRNPEDSNYAILLAAILAKRTEYASAVRTLEGVLDTPPLPLGLKAWQRINGRIVAAFNITEYSIRAESSAEDDAEKATWLARANEARGFLVTLIPESSANILLIDAKIAVAEKDLFAAQKLLEQHNRNTNNRNVEALWLTAQIAQRLRQPGNAKAALEQILARNPGESSAHVALSDVELSLNHPEAALEHLVAALKSHPNDPALLERVADIKMRIDPTTATDPIDRAIYDARRIAAGTESDIADPAAGIERLSRALDELGDNVQLYIEKARLQMLAGNAEAATETIKSALALYPDDETLLRYQQAAANTGSVDDTIQMIQDSDDPQIRKLMAIANVYFNADREPEAIETLARAEALDPMNAVLIEIQFGHAFLAKNIERARQLAERAQAANADQIDGLSYRARLFMLEGKDDDALAALSQAVQRSPNNTSLWRILGNLQLNMGRAADAIGSFQHALSIRPNDISSIMDYCNALIGLNRLEEALEVARRSESSARRNNKFMSMLLALEARVGDKDGARARREKILASRPKDIPNRIALADLYITLGMREEALTLIGQTRQEFGQSPALVQLEARWFAEGNKMEAARRVFARDIASTHPAERAGKYVTLARFMLSRGQSKSGIIALQQAAKAEPDGLYEIDTLLASTLMRYKRNDEAYDILRALLDAGIPDENNIIAKQAAEALISLDRINSAETLLTGLGNAETDITIVLLRSRIQLRQDNDKAARAMLDDAVTRWPEDYRVWLLRAEAEAVVPELLNDAIADIDQALTLRPDLAEAYRRKAELLTQAGREDEALAAYRDAVRLNPALEELRSALLVTMVRRGLESDAIQMAEEWFEIRPRDLELRTRIAELFLLGDMQNPAIDILQDATQIEMQPRMVLRLVELLLASTPPRTGDAERVFAGAKTIVATDASLLLARARLFSLTNRLEAAKNDCLASFGLIPKQADAMTFWYGSMSRVFASPQQTLGFLRTLRSKPEGADWADLFAARILLENPDTAAAGLTELAAVTSRTRNPEVKYSALRAHAGNRLAKNDHEGAVALWKQALQLRPEDWQIENNIAFTLAVNLNSPADALPYAEAAALHAPNNPAVLDTLGTVLLELHRPLDALSPLEAAVRATRGSPDDAQYMVRFAQAHAEAGNQQEARELLTQIEALLDQGRKLDDGYTALLQQVREGLGQG